jgi:hypothetical protein
LPLPLLLQPSAVAGSAAHASDVTFAPRATGTFPRYSAAATSLLPPLLPLLPPSLLLLSSPVLLLYCCGNR